MTKRQTEAYKNGEHVMSKLEASVMRRIQSKTGLSKEEVLSKRKYRVMLSDTQAPGRSLELKSRRLYMYGTPTKWEWGSEKTMFMQHATQILDGDKEAAARLYKRYAGGLIDDKRPQAFYYRHFNSYQPCIDIMKAIDKTDGMFVFSQTRDEVGFAYEASLTMFSLVYTPAQ